MNIPGRMVVARRFDKRFGIGVGVLLWVVVYAPTGPGASFSETPLFRLWTRKCVCVCVCVINSLSYLNEKKWKKTWMEKKRKYRTKNAKTEKSIVR